MKQLTFTEPNHATTRACAAIQTTAKALLRGGRRP
jgi:hypothetical protein